MSGCRNCRAELERPKWITGVPYFQVISFKIERDGPLPARVLLRHLCRRCSLPAELSVLSGPVEIAYEA